MNEIELYCMNIIISIFCLFAILVFVSVYVEIRERNKVESKPKIIWDEMLMDNEYHQSIKFWKDNNINVCMTLECNIHTIIYSHMIAKYVLLHKDNITSVYYGDKQITIWMKRFDRNFNITLFDNGYLRMIGCENLEDFFSVVTILNRILYRGTDIIITKNNIKHVDFIAEPDKIGIFDVKIQMINSNFKLPFEVDEKKLSKILLQEHNLKTEDTEFGYIDCTYYPSIYSPVNIKHNASISIFKKDAIIITKTYQQLISAYQFQERLLYKYMDQIKIIE